MSVLPMKRVLVVGLRKDRKQMLELLQRKGVLQISTDVIGRELQGDTSCFKQIDMSGAKSTFERNVAMADQALTVLNQDSEDPNKPFLFAGRRHLSLADYEKSLSKSKSTMNIASKIGSLDKERAEIQAEIPKLEAQREALVPWMSYELPLNFSGTTYTNCYIGTFPNEVTLEEIYEGILQHAGEITGVDVTIISSSQEQTCVQIVCLKKDGDQVEEALRHINFARPVVSGDVPGKQDAQYAEKIDSLTKRLEEIHREISGYGKYREDLKKVSDYFAMRAGKYEVISQLYQSDRVFLLSGYVPAGKAKGLENLLSDRFDCVVETRDPAEDENAPVLLKNNGYAAPIEGVIAGYALPDKGEIDPTFLASIFYYCLFGLMLGDAGYGILMIVGCAFLLHKNKDTIEPGMKKTLQMFLYCGIGTTFWGIMFGSFFGDAVTVIGHCFFNVDVAFPTIWFSQMNDPIKMLGFAFVLGIVHLFAGLGALCYTDFKDKKPLDAIYDGVFWFMLLIGCLVLLLGMDMIKQMFSLNLTIPAPLTKVSLVMILIGAIGIVLTGGRESKNWFKRILKGLYSIYGISSWLSDVLSYSRLLALGLATGVIAQVFNSMGQLIMDGIPVKFIGGIIFVVIFVIGHTLNLGINALGAYVHTNRLEYVEFFGKFYNGGGEPFKPFEEDTRYFKVSE